MLESLNELHSTIEPTSRPVIVGIDEAGRGPVIGPMVYGMYVGHSREVTCYKDSKLLAPQSRERLFGGMKCFAYYKVHPVYITSHMEAGSKNLNEIAKEAVVALLTELRSKCKNVEAVYIDGLGNNEEYKQTLQQHFDYEFIIENRADSKYQVVSGASIVAKVTRDEAVASCDDGRCGSGYPGDPRTKSWLEANRHGFRGFPEYVRHSWQTVKDLLGEKRDRRLEKDLSGFFAGPD